MGGWVEKRKKKKTEQEGKKNIKKERTEKMTEGRKKNILKFLSSSQELFWLPSNLPDGVHLLVSVMDTHTSKLYELESNRNYQVLKVQPLTKDDRETLTMVSRNAEQEALFHLNSQCMILSPFCWKKAVTTFFHQCLLITVDVKSIIFKT